MTTPFTIFLVSLIALIFLIVHKVVELHKGTPFVSANLRDRGDEIIVENVLEKTKLFLAKGWLAARRTVLSTRMHIHRVAIDALHGVQQVVVRLIDRMKHVGTGRGIAADTKKKPTGSVSFFLKHVSDQAKRVTDENTAGAETAREAVAPAAGEMSASSVAAAKEAKPIETK